MTKILVLSDSTALPRDTPETVLFEETWPMLLRETGIDVVQSSIGGGTSYDLYKQSAYYKMCFPEVVIVQVGIVDCAPRALTYQESLILNYWRASRALLGFFLSRWGSQIRNVRNANYVPLADFEQNLQQIKGMLSSSRLIALGILPASAEYERKLPRIQQRVQRYNEVLASEFREGYLSLDDLPSAGIMSDHHHPNVLGHRIILEKILHFVGQV